MQRGEWSSNYSAWDKDNWGSIWACSDISHCKLKSVEGGSELYK